MLLIVTDSTATHEHIFYLNTRRMNDWFNVDDMISGGDVTDTDGPSYASESTAAILMLVFQYVNNGGMQISVFS